MRPRLLAVTLLATAGVVSAAPTPKNPIARDWTIAMTTKDGTRLGLDTKSFKVISPGDLFTFDTVVIFGEDDVPAPLAKRKAAAHVSTVKASCATKQAQVIADTLHDRAGAIIGVNEGAKLDKMDAVSPTSFVGRVVELVCAGKPLFQRPSAGQAERQRGLGA